MTNFILFQLEKDERSDDESEAEEGEDDDAGNERLDHGAEEHCWEKSRDSLNCTLSKLTSSCVLNNLTNHRASAAHRMRKAQ